MTHPSQPDPLPSDPAAEPMPRDREALWLGPERAARRLVLLHGWGADADDLLDLGRELVAGLEGGDTADTAGEAAGEGLSVVALRAPWPHPGGFGRQWYDLQRPQWPELPEARRSLRARLLALAESVPLAATVLLGFSQGGAMAVDVATGGDEPAAEALPLAGLISCSGYPHPGWQPRAEGLAVLLTHGLHDPVVPAEACEALEQQLQAAGARVRRTLFAGGHGIDPQLFPLMREFLASAWQARS